MRIGMFGTRGVPARYGGFETAVEEIGVRLVDRGHEVVVYCRGEDKQPSHRGMSLVHLPALRHRVLETLSHTALSTLHAAARGNLDAAVIFNAANAPLAPVLQRAGVPVAVHVDGLEWNRGKWEGAGRYYYLTAEAVAVALADTVIADADEIAAYYAAKFGISCEVITYGAPIRRDVDSSRLAELGLKKGGFHLVVARFEPENNVHLVVEGYRQSNAQLPLVVVGANPYPTPYTKELTELLSSDPRIRAVGSIYDQELLDVLYASALTYEHGHSVGGTNPSLLRAMGAGAAVLAHDNRFNREVLGSAGWFFENARGISAQLRNAELSPEVVRAFGSLAQRRAEQRYDWDDVATGYEKMCIDLAANGPTYRGARGVAKPRPRILKALRAARHVLEDWPASAGARPDQITLPKPRPASVSLPGPPSFKGLHAEASA